MCPSVIDGSRPWYPEIHIPNEKNRINDFIMLPLLCLPSKKSQAFFTSPCLKKMEKNMFGVRKKTKIKSSMGFSMVFPWFWCPKHRFPHRFPMVFTHSTAPLGHKELVIWSRSSSGNFSLVTIASKSRMFAIFEDKHWEKMGKMVVLCHLMGNNWEKWWFYVI